MAVATKRKEERLEARVTPGQKRLIERAARIRGATVTEFVIASAQSAAEKTIQESERIRLHGESATAFVRLLLRPPAPNQRLRAAAARYKKGI